MTKRTAATSLKAASAAARKFTADVNAAGGVHMRFNDDDAASTRSIDRVFVGLGATLDGMPAALRDAVPTIRAAFAANFRTETGRKRWEQLAPRTRDERIRLGYNPAHPILVRTGALREHVLTAPAVITRTNGGVELRIEPGQMVKGVRKYRALAKGDASRNLPGRPMVVLSPAWVNRATSTISRSLRTRAMSNGIG